MYGEAFALSTFLFVGQPHERSNIHLTSFFFLCFFFVERFLLVNDSPVQRSGGVNKGNPVSVSQEVLCTVNFTFARFLSALEHGWIVTASDGDG